MPVEYETVIQARFLEDLEFWISTDRKTALKILALMKEIRRDPFNGTGKPEQLKYLPGKPWSRRITQEHRLVYLVTTNRIDFLQARFHYE
jgi:toxin YoeB